MSEQGNVFQGFTKRTMTFFKELTYNNNKAWFESHKDEFAGQVKTKFIELVNELNPVMTRIDPDFETRPDRVISRIYRDMRFSKNKAPYKTTMWITYKRMVKDWQNYPAYFFELSGDSYRYGMGFYAASKATMDIFRKAVYDRTKKFTAITGELMAKRIFTVEGDLYKRAVPNTLPDDMQTWYQRRNIYLVCNRQINEVLFSREIVDELQKGFVLLQPLYDFMYRMKG